MLGRSRLSVPAGCAIAIVLAGCGARSGLEVSAPMEPIDAGVRSDAPVTRDAGPPRAVCALGAPNASVRGTTPLGPVDARFAWAAEIEACGGHLWLGEASSLEWSSLLEPRPPEPWILVSFVGLDEVRARVGAGGEEREALGTLRVDERVVPIDDPRAPGESLCVCTDTGALPELPCEPGTLHGHIAGELVVEAPGWSLRGRFRAPHCHALHGVCF